MADNYVVLDANGLEETFRAHDDGSVKIPIHRRDSTGGQKIMISRYLDTNGDGTGTKNAIGNYAGGATPFYIAPAAGEVFRIGRMIGSYSDSSGVDTDKYGNNITLTNGIVVRTNLNTVIIDLTDGVPILSNGGWAHQCHDLTAHQFGTGNDHLTFRWTFTNAGQFIRLDGDTNDTLEVVLNDDFSGLVHHRFLVQGYIE